MLAPTLCMMTFGTALQKIFLCLLTHAILKTTERNLTLPECESRFDAAHNADPALLADQDVRLELF